MRYSDHETHHVLLFEIHSSLFCADSTKLSTVRGSGPCQQRCPLCSLGDLLTLKTHTQAEVPIAKSIK